METREKSARGAESIPALDLAAPAPRSYTPREKWKPNTALGAWLFSKLVVDDDNHCEPDHLPGEAAPGSAVGIVSLLVVILISASLVVFFF